MRASTIFVSALAFSAFTLLNGCVASKIVAAPFKVAGGAVGTAVDATTQTRSEKEEDIGRRVLAERKRERDACLKRAENKAERKQCKQDYEDY